MDRRRRSRWNDRRECGAIRWTPAPLTLDKLRARYGLSIVYFGNVHDARENAPMRISFTHIPDERVEG